MTLTGQQIALPADVLSLLQRVADHFADTDAPLGIDARRLLDGQSILTDTDLARLLPDAAIEEVGERRELVIYTGWSAATYDETSGEWTDTPDGRLVSMPEFLD